MPIIAHIDLDAFFASVEERDKPYLKGLPVVIGADPEGGAGRGVVATANYAAREYGIHSAMPISRAWQCSEAARRSGRPAVAFLSSRFRTYATESEHVFDIVRLRASRLQMTSVDEAYFVFKNVRSYKQAAHEAARLQREIKRKRRLTASIGIGPNKMVAKIASDFNKPAGCTVTPPSKVEQFLAPLSVRAIPGVGPKLGARLATAGIKTIADLQARSWDELANQFGASGFDLYERSRGIASAELTQERLAKSIGEHETLRHDTSDMRALEALLERMADDIVERMEKKGFTGFRTVVLTVRFEDFETHDRSITAKEPLKTARSLELKGLRLLLPFLEKRGNPKGKKIRMLGLRIENLAE